MLKTARTGQCFREYATAVPVYDMSRATTDTHTLCRQEQRYLHGLIRMLRYVKGTQVIYIRSLLTRTQRTNRFNATEALEVSQQGKASLNTSRCR